MTLLGLVLLGGSMAGLGALVAFVLMRANRGYWG